MGTSVEIKKQHTLFGLANFKTSKVLTNLRCRHEFNTHLLYFQIFIFLSFNLKALSVHGVAIHLCTMCFPKLVNLFALLFHCRLIWFSDLKWGKFAHFRWGSHPLSLVRYLSLPIKYCSTLVKLRLKSLNKNF